MNIKSTLIASLSLLVLWEIGSLGLRTALLPDPIAVFRTFLLDLPKGLWWHILISSWRMLAGMAIAVVLGVPLGLWLGQSKKWDKIASPLVYVTYPVPKIVLLPIVLLFLGIGDTSKIFIISLILFYQVLVVVRDASIGIRPELIQSVRSLGARKRDLFRYVYLPACLPATLTALRVSTGTAIAVLYIAESFATRSGLGFYIMDTWQSLAYPQMYSAVVAMSLLGLTVYVGLDRLEKRMCGWVKAGAV